MDGWSQLAVRPPTSLFSSGTQLFLFLVAGTELCFLDLVWEWCWWHPDAVAKEWFPQSKTFWCPMLWDAQKHRGEHSQDSWPELARGVCHTAEHHAQYIDWRELASRVDHCSGTGWTLIRRWWESDCTLLISLEFCYFLSLSS